ncbi:MAG: choice-of-anchor D domain-containing protein, partial [Desulfobacterales bacterium]|nr:choice-of-anchor D domain-containing protein [Desulfobacterales bacterium]
MKLLSASSHKGISFFWFVLVWTLFILGTENIPPTHASHTHSLVAGYGYTNNASFTNNDKTDEIPYTVTIQGVETTPKIDLSGNGNSISNGSTSPSTSNHTDFDKVDIGTGAQTRTFTIKNSGTATLFLTGNPLVSVTGDHASEFAVSQQPETPVDPNKTTTFTVTFNPNQTGLRTATLSIKNSDTDYTFAIQGTGTAPKIDLSGNSNPITNGSTTPSADNHTDFDKVDTGSGALARTFTIQNSGTGTLSLSGDPLVSVTGDHASEFT